MLKNPTDAPEANSVEVNSFSLHISFLFSLSVQCVWPLTIRDNVCECGAHNKQTLLLTVSHHILSERPWKGAEFRYRHYQYEQQNNDGQQHPRSLSKGHPL